MSTETDQLQQTAYKLFGMIKSEPGAAKYAIHDPALSVLFDIAFTQDAVLALTDAEAEAVQNVALLARAFTIHFSKALDKFQPGSNPELPALLLRKAAGMEQLLGEAITTLGGSLDRSRRSLEPPS